jgi:hypothetical protein
MSKIFADSYLAQVVKAAFDGFVSGGFGGVELRSCLLKA